MKLLNLLRKGMLESTLTTNNGLTNNRLVPWWIKQMSKHGVSVVSLEAVSYSMQKPCGTGVITCCTAMLPWCTATVLSTASVRVIVVLPYGIVRIISSIVVMWPLGSAPRVFLTTRFGGGIIINKVLLSPKKKKYIIKEKNNLSKII